MKAFCLLLVLLTAKLVSLAGRDLPWSWWSPLAFIWQDLLVAMVFAAVDALLFRRAWMGWISYGTIAAYAALNVGVIQTLSTPLTGPLLQAAAGPLADSIRHHIDAPNLIRMGFVLAMAGLAPMVLWRFRDGRPPFWIWPAIAPLMVLGVVGVMRTETAGLHRNALVALWRVSLPETDARSGPMEWRTSPFQQALPEALSRFRGIAAGRNVVLITLESTGASYLRPWGAAEDPMPNLTQLARSAVLFENAYCVYPESIKGLFSYLCSRYPGYDMEAERYEQVRTTSLAGVLADVGYQTGLFHSGRFMYLGMEEMIRNRGFHTLDDAGAISGNHESSFGVDEPATVDHMLRWIDGLEENQPFMISYLPIAGHHPYPSPVIGPFPENTEVDRYRNALHYGDQAIGQLMDGLRTRSLETNTLFVIFGDHGEAFGDHQGNIGHTLFLYEQNVRVPLMIAAPGLIDEPVYLTQTASLIDVAPTLLESLDLPVPKAFQGQSLWEGNDRMALFFTDYSLGLLGLRDGHWKFIHELDSGRSKLFDLTTDPEERQNLAPQYPDRVRAYRDRLLAWGGAQRRLLGSEVVADGSDGSGG